jgi:hypothetical protein
LRQKFPKIDQARQWCGKWGTLMTWADASLWFIWSGRRPGKKSNLVRKPASPASLRSTVRREREYKTSLLDACALYDGTKTKVTIRQNANTPHTVSTVRSRVIPRSVVRYTGGHCSRASPVRQDAAFSVTPSVVSFLASSSVGRRIACDSADCTRRRASRPGSP